MRISGVELPNEKRIDISLAYLYGVGRSNAKKILQAARVQENKRTKDLDQEEVNRIQKVLETIRLEGDLKREIYDNIKRLKELGSYRGIRHSRNLPARGQNTRRNARTKRGKRVTIGAIKKEMAAKAAPPTGGAAKK